MNVFKKKKYAQDAETMMFYMLLITAFFLPFDDSIATYALLTGWAFYLLKVYFVGWKWKKTFIDTPLAIFVVISFLSIFNSPEKAFSFYNCYHLVGKYVLIYYLTVQCVNSEQRIKKLLVFLGISALFVIIYGFFQYVVEINTIGMNWIDPEAFPEMKRRIFSTWQNPNLFAGYLNMVMSLTFGIALFTHDKKSKFIVGTLFLLAAICLGLTYARGACFSIAVVIAAYGMFYNRKILLPFAVLIAALLYMDTALLDRLMSVFSSMDTSSELRIALWESTVAMILDHPFLGIGWGAYYFVYPVYDFYMQGNFIKIVHAHNMYLNIAAEIGLIGFAGYMTCLFKTMWCSLRDFKYLSTPFLRGTLLGTGLALAVMAFNGLTDYVLFNAELSMLFWLIMAIGISLLNSESLHKTKVGLKSQHVGFTSLAEAVSENAKKD